jgi:putative membrane-bound dehydrogenase-like protein
MRVDLVASEPLVRQPVAIEFDDRGRLWVMQYLQYPNPAELKRTQVDRYSRTKYDRIPEPPPRGPRGADRLAILEDSDGDGRMDSTRDFVDGLNLASGFAFGWDGVFVLNVPYLLFYADRDRDDVPDGPPEVLLQGFGMEDAHSVANSLTWGPDGWLYGCQGSTVTANIRGIEFQQGVWRYHPKTRAFELFCEGGGNSWGLDFDREGNLLYSTNYGGHVLLHGVQGGYFVKSFAKHGALHNPFSFGYFEHAPHEKFTGGHVTVGGMVYQADLIPQLRNRYVAGDLLGHNVLWHSIVPTGSTFRTVHGGPILSSNDTWFATTDLTVGPDGAIYVSDWHDSRTAHPDPDAEWDRSNGRVYRISSSSVPSDVRTNRLDFREHSMATLLVMHRDANQWNVRHARQEWVRRFPRLEQHQKDQVLSELRIQLQQEKNTQIGLEILWTLYCLNGFDEQIASWTLESESPAIRAWTIRFLGESTITQEMAHQLDAVAEKEPDVRVRAQLACTAARLPAPQALPIINANINRDCDNDDSRIPLMWWWAIEKHSIQGRDEVLRRFLRPTFWNSQLGREMLMPRLVRRYASEDREECVRAMLQLIDCAPDKENRQKLWNAALLGMQSITTERSPATHELLSAKIAKERTQHPNDAALLRLALMLDDSDALRYCLDQIHDEQQNAQRRSELLGWLVGKGDPELLRWSLNILQQEKSFDEALRMTAVRVVSKHPTREASEALLQLLERTTSSAMRSQIVDVFVANESWAESFLSKIDQGTLPASVTSMDQVRRISAFKNPRLNTWVSKHWGKLDTATREEKLAEVRRLNNDLRASAGDSLRGKALFTQHCANCHTLFGEGKKVGPDLTSANRQDRDYLLVSMVDPDSVIRKEYLSTIIVTMDGRTLNGLVTRQDDNAVTLVTNKSESITLQRADIAELKESQVSLMPSDLYRIFKPQELRDLFAYIQGPG